MKFAMYNHKIISVRSAKGHLKYKCPFCRRRMVYHKATIHHEAYFSHVLSKGRFNNPGETSEHLAGKQQISQFFKTKDNSVVIEKYLPEINQWPDIMVNDTIIEFQCSPISARKLNQRIAGYSKMGLKSWWILGSPYQKRHLRPKYIAKFLNYSSHLGFFILFWKVTQKCLEIHYALSESSGKLRYRKECIFTYHSLKNFIHHNQMIPRLINRSRLINRVTSEIHLNQKRLFHGDRYEMIVQQEVSQFHNTMMGCPIICHLPSDTFPIFRKRALLWRILVVLLINKYSDLIDVYRIANSRLNLPLTFCQIDNYEVLYKRAFLNYISLLKRHHYVSIDKNCKKITRLKKLRWFNSYYDKSMFLKRYR